MQYTMGEHQEFRVVKEFEIASGREFAVGDIIRFDGLSIDLGDGTFLSYPNLRRTITAGYLELVPEAPRFRAMHVARKPVF